MAEKNPRNRNSLQRFYFSKKMRASVRAYTRKEFYNLFLFTLGVLPIFWFGFLANKFRPVPYTDWAYFWQISGDLTGYHKGGIIGFLYWPFKGIGTPAWLSAFFVNSISWTLLYHATFGIFLSSFSQLDPYWKPARLILVFSSYICFLFWFSGMSSIVNTELPFVGLCSFFAGRLVQSSNKNSTKLFYTYAFLLGLSASIRIQGFLGLFAAGTLFGLTLFIFKKITLDEARKWSIALLIITIACLGLESVLRANSAAKESIRVYNRLPLYTGLLLTRPDSGCGSWSPEAAEAAEKEINLPLNKILRDRLLRFDYPLLSIIKCKIIRFHKIQEFSASWLADSVPYESSRDKAKIFSLTSDAMRIARLEWLSFGLLKIAFIINFACLLVTPGRKDAALANFFFASLVWVCFLALHLIFELNPKYLIIPYTAVTLALLNVKKPSARVTE